jgi:hypothetical protein
LKPSPPPPQNCLLFLGGEDFICISLDIQTTLFKKKRRKSAFRGGESRFRRKAGGLFKRRKPAERRPEKPPKRPFLRSPQGGWAQTENPRKYRACGDLRKKESPSTGEPLTGLGKFNGRTRRGDLEPFSSVLQSLTCDLFESQPSGERKPLFFTSGKRLKRPFRPQLAWMGHLRGELPKSEELYGYETFC